MKTPLLARLARLMPVFFAATAILAVLQFVVMAFSLIGKGLASSWLTQHGRTLAEICAVVAGFGLAVVALSLMRAAGRLPAWLSKRSRLMDILDRLTNRQELERRLEKPVVPTIIDAELLAATLRGRVVGQDAICADVAATIRRRCAMEHRKRPIGVFLFAGPPGAGKTYLGKVLAEALNRRLVHFDMTQYASGAFAASSLFGAPRGYVGSNSYGKLTAALRDAPESVVLLDEFEKAHCDVHKNFLTAWNDGFVTEASDGGQIATNRAIFVLTTNAAVEDLAAIAAEHAQRSDDLRRAADGALRKAGFAPEVLSRIDRIFVFSTLQELDVARVAVLEIEAMIKGYGLAVEDGGIDPQILIDLMERQRRHGTTASARDLVRAIEEAIADSLIEAKQRGVMKIGLVDIEGRVETVAAAVQ